MSMETDFRALLVNDPTTGALIGARWYPATYAQATVDPAGRYTRVGGAEGLHMQGGDGLDAALMQIDVRATSAASALAVRDAIVAKLHGFKGTEGGTAFQLITLTADRGLQFDDAGATSYYTASLDFAVWASAA